MSQESNILSLMARISEEDLQYIEKDLCFHELVSLGFLLFGENRANAEFILQKLLVVSQATNRLYTSDILIQYSRIQPDRWRLYLMEGLTIIGAKRVVRKLGFQWEDLRLYYFPHICELSVCIHPVLKSLYRVCEKLTPADACTLVMEINDQEQSTTDQHLRFYDYAYMEIFLMDWITKRIISIGDAQLRDVDLEVLLAYLKLHELYDIRFLLTETINHNAEEEVARAGEVIAIKPQESVDSVAMDKASVELRPNERPVRKVPSLDPNECYSVIRERAGFVLIINQKDFYEETSADLKHLLPKQKLGKRQGTDVDKQRLMQVFSEFGYTPDPHDNLTHIEMLHRIRETVKRSVLYDSLIVCILSHGVDGIVYGSNSIPVAISQIEKIMTDDNLRGKPKMLIIQACQKDDAVVEKTRNSHSFSTTSADKFLDIIKAMSTVPGYPSIRHTTTGTWFIQALCEAVERFGDQKHMLDILIVVARDVTNKRGNQNELMVPSTSHTLTKYFCLPSRVQ